MMKYSNETRAKIRDLYIRGHGQRLIGKELNMPWQSVWPHIKDISKNQRLDLPSRGTILPLPKKSKRLTKAKARLIGYLMGDGHVSTYEKRCRRLTEKGITAYSYPATIVSFYNKEDSVIKRFLNDCYEVYDIIPKYNRERMEVKTFRKEIFQDLHKFGRYGSMTWRIPKQILCKRKYVAEWVKAFCDSEAHIEKDRPRISIFSINKAGLAQIQTALHEFGIRSNIYGPYAGAFRLRISGKQDLSNFLKHFGFYHTGKKTVLIKHVQG